MWKEMLDKKIKVGDMVTLISGCMSEQCCNRHGFVYGKKYKVITADEESWPYRLESSTGHKCWFKPDQVRKW